MIMTYGPRKKNPAYDVYGFRKRMGWTQPELAKFVGATLRSVTRWERDGVKPLYRYIRRMKQMDRDKAAGVVAEKPGTVPPPVQRKLPVTRPAIGVAPSSY